MTMKRHHIFFYMALLKCPECSRQVSDQAAACRECGYPIRKVEYKFVNVCHRPNGGYGGRDEYERLLREGWQVVDERYEELKMMMATCTLCNGIISSKSR